MLVSYPERYYMENRDILMSTGKETIIEKTTNDDWGCGEDGSGKNMLGLILMEVREELSFI